MTVKFIDKIDFFNACAQEWCEDKGLKITSLKTEEVSKNHFKTIAETELSLPLKPDKMLVTIKNV